MKNSGKEQREGGCPKTLEEHQPRREMGESKGSNLGTQELGKAGWSWVVTQPVIETW